jgi:signal transduction histidine kinase
MVTLSEQPRPAGEPPPTVLVIDDERGPRESLRILLKSDYCVLCADSVDAGIAMLQQHRPDTVVMDIRMPGKNGIEGLRLIRELDGVVSVIMFTGFGALETAQEALRLGANDYVKKPFDAFELRKVIHRHVQRTRRERSRVAGEKELVHVNEELQRELERRAHLATLGQKSAELVHDLRSPLTVIQGYVDMLIELMKTQESGAPLDREETASYLQNIEESVLRCRDMAEMWLDASRGNLRRAQVDLGRLIQSVAQDGQSAATRQGAGLQVDPGGEALMMEADELQLRRAVQNLVTNAIEAVSPGTGKVRIACLQNGDGIELSVEDNGSGMTEEQVRQATEPFFSTKQKKGGTGLGLFIARQVVEAHGGELRIRSRVGEGTRMTLAFPNRIG